MAAAPPLEPHDALKTFQLPDGWLIELIAAEPLVVDPVAIAWDERGRMYVAEMRDYPNAADPAKRGRIRLLTDTDGDGRMDRADLFASDVAFANGVLPYRGGILVTSAPDILYLKDTDGDGRADVREPVITGFTRGNQQLLVNGLRHGLDNWIYGANGRSNGSLRFAGDPPDRAVSLVNTDFRFRLDSGQLEPASGFSQFGLAFDEWGNRFLSWNTIHIRHVVIERPYLERNPHLILADPTAHIAHEDHGDAGRVYPISRPQDNFHGEPGGYFNATSGIEVDRGGVFPPPYGGSAFVGEPLRNIVHRDELVPHGVTFLARRGEHERDREFLASTDPWFRPVNVATGPDGALYVVDFYREWIEHPDFVPDSYEEGIDFYHGSDRGRIWRLRPRNARLHEIQDLSRIGAAELIELLSHPNGWYRDTAMRLLIERGDKSVVAALERAAREHPSPHARIYAVRTIEGLALQRLGPGIVEQLARDSHPRVREDAIPLLDSPSRLAELADDPDPRVRFQVALALGNSAGWQSAQALIKIARRDLEDPWTRAAVLTSIGPFADEFLQDWLKTAQHDEPSPGELDLLAAAATTAAAQANSISPEIAAVLDRYRLGPPARGLALLAGLAEGWRGSGGSIREKLVLLGGAELAAAWMGIASRAAFDPGEPPHVRRLGIELLALGRDGEDLRKLAQLIDPQTPSDVQRVVVKGLVASTEPRVPELLLERWPGATVAVRRQIAETMLTSDMRVDAFLKALESGLIAPAEVEVVPRAYLTRWPDADLRLRAQRLFAASEDRQVVIHRYGAALSLKGDATRGEKLFTEKTCATCHRVDGRGGSVGPDLSAIASRPPRQLLEDILDPNRQVAPEFLTYIVTTREGHIYIGSVVHETSTHIILRQADGQDLTIVRQKIASLQSTGRSLMPEGLEQALDMQQMADLIRFLREGPMRP